jgi:hypothetical protein
MRITLQLTPEATREMRLRSREAKRRPLTWLERPPTPVHPNTDDPELASFFEIMVEDSAEAARLVRQLQADPAVTGAYVKPDDALP